MAPTWISFSGLDGAGKSTQIRLLEEYLRAHLRSVVRLTMHDDVSLAARLRGSRRRPAAEAALAGDQPSPARDNPRPTRLDKNRDDLLTVLARQGLYLGDLLSFLALRRRPDIRRADVVIMDRCLLDSLVNLLAARRGTRSYVRKFLRLMPAADVSLLLDLDAEQAFARKPEYPLDYMRRRRQAYRDLFAWTSSGCVIDAMQSPDHVHRQILLSLQRASDRPAVAGKPALPFAAQPDASAHPPC